jgi:hypothetical protein
LIQDGKKLTKWHLQKEHKWHLQKEHTTNVKSKTKAKRIAK